jgi:type I restriction enzyme S subunit
MADKYQVSRLSNHVSFRSRAVSEFDASSHLKLIQLENIESHTGFYGYSDLSLTEIKSPKYSFSSGDILVGKLRPNLRKVCVPDADGFCSTDILPLTPLDPSSAHLLGAILRSEFVSRQIESKVKGANLPRISLSELLKIKILWPKESFLLEASNLAEVSASLRSKLRMKLVRLSDVDEALGNGLY